MARHWERMNTRKLTPNDVRQIRELSKTMGNREIWTLYPQVRYKAIWRIVSGEYWRHVR